MKTFTFYADPGHAWLRVLFSDLVRAGLTLSDFSVYSYVDAANDRAFLEEDCDAPRFLAAWERLVGPVEIEERHANRNSPIRDYPNNTLSHKLREAAYHRTERGGRCPSPA